MDWAAEWCFVVGLLVGWVIERIGPLDYGVGPILLWKVVGYTLTRMGIRDLVNFWVI